MEYQKTALNREITVNEIVTVHYFEYTKDFAFSGEMHDFWEMVYIDKGEAIITADAKDIVLHTGQLYIHKPMEYHNIRCNGVSAPNSVIVSFVCHDDILYSISGRVIDCGERLKNMLAAIIAEAQQAFSSPMDDFYTSRLQRREEQRFGCEQMIKLNLELMLIRLVRHNSGAIKEEDVSLHKANSDDELMAQICMFIEANVEKRLRFEDICRKFSLSASAVKSLFRRKMGHGAMDYYNRCRINRAKLMIREQNLNFAQISERLGYSSQHYFSRQFRNLSGMSPTEYADSVKARTLK